jgi:hypothetical protein
MATTGGLHDMVISPNKGLPAIRRLGPFEARIDPLLLQIEHTRCNLKPS